MDHSSGFEWFLSEIYHTAIAGKTQGKIRNFTEASNMRIRIDKSARRLSVWQGRRCLFRCRVQLGFHPQGAKCCEGDGRTPEGRYSVCSQNPQSRFFRSLGISYPNEADAQTALRAGTIDRETARRISSAQRRGLRPPWDSPLGGWIMIHGQPSDGRAATGDWTAGCVAVSDADMEWLFGHVRRGTRVVIRR